MTEAREKLPKPILKMYDREGRIDALAIASGLGESPSTMASVLGVPLQTILENPVTGLIQPRGLRLAGILEELTHYFGGDFKATVVWMRKPHPQLDDLSPLDLLKEGDINTVAAMVRMIGTGEPS
jgi:Protein of unknown function (DUF2384)